MSDWVINPAEYRTGVLFCANRGICDRDLGIPCRIYDVRIRRIHQDYPVGGALTAGKKSRETGDGGLSQVYPGAPLVVGAQDLQDVISIGGFALLDLGGQYAVCAYGQQDTPAGIGR